MHFPAAHTPLRRCSPLSSPRFFLFLFNATCFCVHRLVADEIACQSDKSLRDTHFSDIPSSFYPSPAVVRTSTPLFRRGHLGQTRFK